MSNRIRRLIKRMTEEPFPTDGSLYDLGDGNLCQTEDGYTFHAVGYVSLLQNGCTNSVCSTTLEGLTTSTNIKEIKTESNDIFADIQGYTDIKKEFMKALQSSNPVGILLVGSPGTTINTAAYLAQILLKSASKLKGVFHLYLLLDTYHHIEIHFALTRGV